MHCCHYSISVLRSTPWIMRYYFGDSFSFGFDSVALHLFKSYLEDRYQSVLLDDIFTTPRCVLYDVPRALSSGQSSLHSTRLILAGSQSRSYFYTTVTQMTHKSADPARRATVQHCEPSSSAASTRLAVGWPQTD